MVHKGAAVTKVGVNQAFLQVYLMQQLRDKRNKYTKKEKQKDAFKDHEQSGHLKTKKKVSLEVNKTLSQKNAEQYRLNTMV